MEDEGYSAPPACAETKRRIDKTAEFVLKNGADFEQVILRKNAENTKFAFLDADSADKTAQAERKYYLWVRNMKGRQAQQNPQTEAITPEEFARKRRREEWKNYQRQQREKFAKRRERERGNEDATKRKGAELDEGSRAKRRRTGLVLWTPVIMESNVEELNIGRCDPYEGMVEELLDCGDWVVDPALSLCPPPNLSNG